FIAEAGIGQDVRLCGHLDQKELVELLGVCELFISFSQSEGFPNALVEAMAAGCVPVVRRIPDVTDWILPAELRGLTGDITTVDELSAAWIKMLENKSKRLELKNVVRKKVREDFDAAVIAGRYADFFLNRISQ
ncbi:MAG TPA: glycosyltransferase family 4 protein, partial [Bacteroidota bacterium]|nr:glycosyltransferase family 4 protein [Bacteroidota bacterium]